MKRLFIMPIGLVMAIGLGLAMFIVTIGSTLQTFWRIK